MHQVGPPGSDRVYDFWSGALNALLLKSLLGYLIGFKVVFIFQFPGVNPAPVSTFCKCDCIDIRAN